MPNVPKAIVNGKGKASARQIGKWKREQEDRRELVRELCTEFDESYRDQFLVTKADRKLTLLESADLDRMKSQLLKGTKRLNELDAFLLRDLSEDEEIDARREINKWQTESAQLLSDIETVKNTYTEHVLAQSQTALAPFLGLTSQHLKQQQTLLEATAKQQQTLLETLVKQLTDAKVNGNGSDGSKGCSVKLPKLEIAQFEGDVLKWEGFWKSFESSVHNNLDVPPITKFAYLKSLLKGAALQTLNGLQATEANYEVAIDLLKENFGNEEVIIAQHVNALTYMKPLEPAYTTAELRAFVDEVQGHVRSLQTAFVLGSDDSIGNRMSFEQIVSKLPFSLRRKVYGKARNDKSKHTLHFLFSELRSIIQVNQRSEYTSFAEPKGQSQPNGNGFSCRQSSNPQSTTSALLVSSQNSKTGNSQNRKLKPKCKFCEEKHWSDKCNKYPTVEVRKQFAKANNRCFCCLEEGHVGFKCGYKRPCFFCKQTGHNSALCYKCEKDTAKSATNLLTTTENQPSEATEPVEAQESLGIVPVAQPGCTQNVNDLISSLIGKLDGSESIDVSCKISSEDSDCLTCRNEESSPVAEVEKGIEANSSGQERAEPSSCTKQTIDKHLPVSESDSIVEKSSVANDTCTESKLLNRIGAVNLSLVEGSEVQMTQSSDPDRTQKLTSYAKFSEGRESVLKSETDSKTELTNKVAPIDSTNLESVIGASAEKLEAKVHRTDLELVEKRRNTQRMESEKLIRKGSRLKVVEAPVESIEDSQSQKHGKTKKPKEKSRKPKHKKKCKSRFFLVGRERQVKAKLTRTENGKNRRYKSGHKRRIVWRKSRYKCKSHSCIGEVEFRSLSGSECPKTRSPDKTLKKKIGYKRGTKFKIANGQPLEQSSRTIKEDRALDQPQCQMSQRVKRKQVQGGSGGERHIGPAFDHFGSGVW